MILLLGPISPLTEFLSDQEATLLTDQPIDLLFVERHRPDFLVSYNYRHKIGKEVLQWLGPSRAINLHISLLPYNRGAHPNFWSWLDDTPKGVTIHEVDEGWDTGYILVQREVPLNPEDTFLETWSALQEAVQELLRDNWPALRSGDMQGYPQSAYPLEALTTRRHVKKDLEPYWAYLANGWDTPINKALEVMRGVDRNIEDSANFWELYGNYIHDSL